MPKSIIDDEEILRRRDRNAFDGGYQAGVERGMELRSELLEALKFYMPIVQIMLPEISPILGLSAIAKAEGK